MFLEDRSDHLFQVFVKLTGIDLSDYPAGESMDNPLERLILENIRNNEDLTPPTLAEYANNNPEDDGTDNSNDEQETTENAVSKSPQYNSWRTLRS